MCTLVNTHERWEKGPSHQTLLKRPLVITKIISPNAINDHRKYLAIGKGLIYSVPIHDRWLKNQPLLLLLPPASCAWRLERTGRFGPPLTSVAPPPRKGLAIRDPAPPKLKPPGAVGPPSPRVELILAASRRSLTAVSCASNLEGRISAGMEKEFEGNLPVICCREFLLAIS